MQYVIKLGDKYVRATNVPSLVAREKATVFADRVYNKDMDPHKVRGIEAAEACIRSAPVKLAGAQIERA